MRFSWAQTAAGALFVVVLGGLALLPGRLLGPVRTMPDSLGLPQSSAARVEHAAPPLVVHHTPAKHVATRTLVVLPVVVHGTTPVAAPTPRAARPRVAVPVVQHRAVIARITPKAPRIRTAAHPKPAPALAPAPTPAPTVASPGITPAAVPTATPAAAPASPALAAPAPTTLVATVEQTAAAVVPQIVPYNDEHGNSGNHGHGQGHDNGQGHGNSDGHG